MTNRLSLAILLSLRLLGCKNSSATDGDASTPADLSASVGFLRDPNSVDVDDGASKARASFPFKRDELEQRWGEVATRRHVGALVPDGTAKPDENASQATYVYTFADKAARVEVEVLGHDKLVRSVTITGTPKSPAEQRSLVDLWRALIDLGSKTENEAALSTKIFAELGLTSGKPITRRSVAIDNLVVSVVPRKSGAWALAIRRSRAAWNADQPFDWGVAAGSAPGFGHLNEFGMYRIGEDTSPGIVAAARNCVGRGLALCTDSQWMLACSTDKQLATLPTWTMSPTADRVHAQIRGGGGSCEAPASTSGGVGGTSHVGLCCTRQIAVDDAADGKTTAPFDTVLAYEKALNTKDRALLNETLSERLTQFYLLKDVSRDKVVNTSMQYVNGLVVGLWGVHDRCKVTNVDGHAAADCEGFGGDLLKWRWSKSRYIFDDKNKLSAVIQLSYDHSIDLSL